MLSDGRRKLSALFEIEEGFMLGQIDYHVDVCGECGTQAVPKGDVDMECPNCLDTAPVVRYPVLIVAGEGDAFAYSDEDSE